MTLLLALVVTSTGIVVPADVASAQSPCVLGAAKDGGLFKRLVADFCDRHHMPSRYSYGGLPYNADCGPSIRMEPVDHQSTASHPNQSGSQEYRNTQQQLLSEGRVRDAMQMDIDDIRGKFGAKYDTAINQMLEAWDVVKDAFDQLDSRSCLPPNSEPSLAVQERTSGSHTTSAVVAVDAARDPLGSRTVEVRWNDASSSTSTIFVPQGTGTQNSEVSFRYSDVFETTVFNVSAQWQEYQPGTVATGVTFNCPAFARPAPPPPTPGVPA